MGEDVSLGLRVHQFDIVFGEINGAYPTASRINHDGRDGPSFRATRDQHRHRADD